MPESVRPDAATVPRPPLRHSALAVWCSVALAVAVFGEILAYADGVFAVIAVAGLQLIEVRV